MLLLCEAVLSFSLHDASHYRHMDRRERRLQRAEGVGSCDAQCDLLRLNCMSSCDSGCAACPEGTCSAGLGCDASG